MKEEWETPALIGGVFEGVGCTQGVPGCMRSGAPGGGLIPFNTERWRHAWTLSAWRLWDSAMVTNQVGTLRASRLRVRWCSRGVGDLVKNVVVRDKNVGNIDRSIED